MCTEVTVAKPSKIQALSYNKSAHISTASASPSAAVASCLHNLPDNPDFNIKSLKKFIVNRKKTKNGDKVEWIKNSVAASREISSHVWKNVY